MTTNSFRGFLGRAALLMLTTLILSGCSKFIYTETEIAAPPEIIWDILITFEDYPNWNPYHVKVDQKGPFNVGTDLEITIHKPNGNHLVVPPQILAIEPNKKLSWGGGLWGIFTGEHVFLFEPLPNGNTRVIQQEEFSGLAIPFAELGTIEEGYKLVNAALKKKAESRTQK